jgi:predicted Zn-dependent peptidase
LYTLRKFFDRTIDLLHEMLLSPAFSEEQFNVVRENNKAQFLVNIQKGDVRAMRALRQSIYGNEHPCGMPTEVEDYDRLHIDTLTDFYHRYYGSSHCSIYLSGAIDGGVLARVESLFGTKEWGSTCAVEARDYLIHPSEERQISIVQPDAMQSSIRMGCLLMDVRDEDYLPMRVLTTVLGGYFGSRLMKNVREEKGYTYHISADLVTNTPQVMFMVACEALSDKADEVIGEVHREIYRLQTELVGDDELCMVRNYMRGEICRNYEGAFALTDAYIFMDHLGLPQDHIEQTIEALQTTDAFRLQQLAQQYLNSEVLHVAVVKP